MTPGSHKVGLPEPKAQAPFRHHPRGRLQEQGPRADEPCHTLGIQIAQCRYYLQTLWPNVGIICILGSLGIQGNFHDCGDDDIRGLLPDAVRKDTVAKVERSLQEMRDPDIDGNPALQLAADHTSEASCTRFRV